MRRGLLMHPKHLKEHFVKGLLNLTPFCNRLVALLILVIQDIKNVTPRSFRSRPGLAALANN